MQGRRGNLGLWLDKLASWKKASRNTLDVIVPHLDWVALQKQRQQQPKHNTDLSRQMSWLSGVSWVDILGSHIPLATIHHPPSTAQSLPLGLLVSLKLETLALAYADGCPGRWTGKCFHALLWGILLNVAGDWCVMAEGMPWMGHNLYTLYEPRPCLVPDTLG